MKSNQIGRARTLPLPALRWLTALVLVFIAPDFVFAQGCALCYTQAAGAGSRLIHALRSGIFLLVIPHMLICIGLTFIAYKKRNQFNED
jgi:hypothetical protein